MGSVRRHGRGTRLAGRTLLLGIVAVVALAGCTGTPGPGGTTPATSASGTGPASGPGHHAGSLAEPGGERTYRLYVPQAAASPAVPVPLLVVLHGGGGSGAHFEDVSGFDPLADTAGFVVAYPDALTPPGGALTTWNAGACCGYAARTGTDDVGFVRDLIEHLSGTYRIDPDRVYVAGFSNGGMLAYRLACEDAEQIAAIGVQSATLELDRCDPARPVSLLHIHGTADDHVPLAGGMGSAGVARVAFTPVLSAVDTLAAADHCGAQPAPVPDPAWAGAEVRGWPGCPTGIAVTLVTVQGAGHSWLPGSPAAIWAFLAAHPARG